MDEKILNLLIRSFDQELDAFEQNQLKNALAGSSDLRAEKGRLETLRCDLAAKKESIQFEPFFVQRVMNRLRRESMQRPVELIFFESIAHYFQRLVLVTSVAVAILFTLNWTLSEEKSVTSALGIPHHTYTDLLEPNTSFFEDYQ